MKKWTRLLAVLLTICLLFTSCATVGQSVDSNENTVDTQKVQNLEKLCKVWGYTKYNHPVFLLGEKDWDEELLNLIPVVSKAKEDEVNDILHKWFVSLGEIDYKTLNRVPQWIAVKEEDKIIQADTSWIGKDYLGEELTEDLTQLGPIPNVDRSKAPIKYDAKIPNFSNEPLYEKMDYRDEGYRLLGLFRLWNAMEYHYPYLDILDENWHDLLPKYIAGMLDGKNQKSYELTLASLSAKLQDAHIALYNSEYYIMEAGVYGVPVEIMQAENEIVVSKVLKDDCPLQVGDVIRELDGKDIKDVLAERMEYISVTTEDKFINQIGRYLMRSNHKNIKVKVLRDKEEQTFKVKGGMEYYLMQETAEQPYEILDGNIGLLNPAALQDGIFPSVMSKLNSTDGLVIDLRQYPGCNITPFLAEYLVNEVKDFSIYASPYGSYPGTFLRERKAIGRTQETKVSMYEKSVVVLMNEKTQSQAEYLVMSIRNGENVTVMGENSVGSDGDVAYLPLPGGMNMSFSSQGVYTPEGEQTQRIGLAPDIEVYPTIEGIKEGRDELMEAAIKYLKENK